MVNRHNRRKATAKRRKELRTATLDQHFEEALRRVRTEFERTGQLDPVFECLTDRKSFHIPANWPNDSARAAVCVALKDCFRRRGVNRYVFTSEAWASKTPGVPPADDPDAGESVQVLAVERNGARRYACAEITRNGQTRTLGPWHVNSETPQSWLAELLEDGYSDRSTKPEPAVLGRIKADWLYQHPEQAADFQDSFEIHSELGDLIEYELQKDGGGGPLDMFMALESVLRGIVTDMGSPTGIISEFARFLRDHPDRFSMFADVPEQVPSMQHVRRCKAALGEFNCEKRKADHTPSAIFGAFMNMYMAVGSQAIGALALADRIESWDPKYQAKLRQAGLRSSFELDDEEGRVFIALTADRYPVGLMGRRNADGDLFVSKLVTCSQANFAAAVEKINEMGMGLILGSDAEELLGKMEQVIGTVLRTDQKKEIWELEEWGPDEWAEQTTAELGFAIAMDVQYAPDGANLNGNVAGYRVRRAPDGLVLVPSDGDEEIFVGVKVKKNKQEAWVLGWLRGCEGKIPRFYQKNCWVIPAEELQNIEELPGRERLRAMPRYEGTSS